MSLEPQAEPQSGQPVDSQANLLALGERRSLMDVWRVLTKQRLTILTVTILFVAAAAWHAFRTPPVYESVSRVEIKPNTMNGRSDRVIHGRPEHRVADRGAVIEERLGGCCKPLRASISSAGCAPYPEREEPASRRPPPKLPRTSATL